MRAAVFLFSRNLGKHFLTNNNFFWLNVWDAKISKTDDVGDGEEETSANLLITIFEKVSELSNNNNNRHEFNKSRKLVQVWKGRRQNELIVWRLQRKMMMSCIHEPRWLSMRIISKWTSFGWTEWISKHFKLIIKHFKLDLQERTNNNNNDNVELSWIKWVDSWSVTGNVKWNSVSQFRE